MCCLMYLVTDVSAEGPECSHINCILVVLSLVLDELDVAVHSEEDSTSKWPGWMVEPLPCLEGELRGAHWYLSCCSMVSGSTAHEGYHS